MLSQLKDINEQVSEILDSSLGRSYKRVNCKVDWTREGWSEIVSVNVQRGGEAEALSLWCSFEEDYKTGDIQTFADFDVDYLGIIPVEGLNKSYSLNKHFQGFLQPTEVELEEFYMHTGRHYILSKEFFEELTKTSEFAEGSVEIIHNVYL